MDFCVLKFWTQMSPGVTLSWMLSITCAGNASSGATSFFFAILKSS